MTSCQAMPPDSGANERALQAELAIALRSGQKKHTASQIMSISCFDRTVRAKGCWRAAAPGSKFLLSGRLDVGWFCWRKPRWCSWPDGL